MDKKELKKYIKAGEILQEAQKKARKSIKPGQKLLDIALEIEKGIGRLGGAPAFPVNLSVNQNAAHYTPGEGDKTGVGEKDVLKVDIGVHVDGFVADAAFTLDFSGKHGKMVEASEKALEDAIALVEKKAFGKEGLKLGEIGTTIQKAITSFGARPIQNLSGHGLDEWKTHAPPSIPNIGNRDECMLEEGMVFAVEPFATDGMGFVKEAVASEIFALDEPRPVRSADARKLLEFISEKYHTLPFAERWLTAELKMGEFGRKVAMRELMKAGCIRAFPVLHEEQGKIVTQAETSVALADGKVVVLV